jgi:hypothetical protein
VVGLGAWVSRVRAVEVAGLAAILGYVSLVAWATTQMWYDLWGALVVIPLLVMVSGHLLVRAAKHDPDPAFLRLLVLAFVLKGFATVGRYWMAFVLYEGRTDAGVYSVEGARLAEFYRDGMFDAELGKAFVGTGFIRALTGVLYAFTGPSIFVAFAFFSLLSFWGLYFIYRAFRIAVPDGDHRRYALLVLLLPSMVFWPSGLGKEAVMTFGIGLAVFGAARLLAGQSRWLLPLLGGLTTTSVVRPHVTAALFAAIAVAVLVRRPNRPATELTPLAWVAALITVLAAGFLMVNQAASFLNIEDVSVSSVDAAIQGTTERTNEADSTFEAVGVNSPLDLPLAAVSVLFRPFIFEAHNVAALIAAVEGTALLGLLALSLPRLRGVHKRLLRQPYLAFCTTYALMFIYAFSNFSNFGILTRERVMVLPFALVFLALPRNPQEQEPEQPVFRHPVFRHRRKEPT